MVEGLTILDSAYKKTKYWRKIVALEKLHPEDLRESSVAKLGNLFTSGSICVIYLMNDEVIGECTAIPLQKVEQDVLDNIVDLDKYLKAKTLYLHSIGVRPEAYSKDKISAHKGVSIAMQMNALVGKIAKDQNYDFIIGHAREGMSLNVAVKLGAKIIKEHSNWFGVGTSYYQVEVDMKKI
ncbi:MAG: hypothetical protein ACP5OA_05200 [Candidatus Woesearchaeota archaeon]